MSEFCMLRVSEFHILEMSEFRMLRVSELACLSSLNKVMLEHANYSRLLRVAS